MSERVYLILVGVTLLAFLYVDVNELIYGLSLLMVLEGVTNWRVPLLMQRARNVQLDTGLMVLDVKQRFEFEAPRALRLVFATVLLISFLAYTEYGFEFLWFFPWFLGFAMFGAGASGVCPMVLFLKWLGFK